MDSTPAAPAATAQVSGPQTGSKDKHKDKDKDKDKHDNHKDKHHKHKDKHENKHEERFPYEKQKQEHEESVAVNSALWTSKAVSRWKHDCQADIDLTVLSAGDLSMTAVKFKDTEREAESLATHVKNTLSRRRAEES